VNRSGGALGVGILLAAVVGAGTARSGGLDYVSCEFDAANGVLRVTEQFSEGALIRRAGERIAALQPDGEGEFEEVDCGVTPTISNTDRIIYRLTSDGSTEARLSLAGGPLAPGRTDEGPTSEIETTVRPSPAAELAELVIRGGGSRDHFRAGRLGLNAGVNLNVAQESTEPDADVTVERPRQVGLSLRPGKGNDTVDLTGGPEMTGPLNLGFSFVAPGRGKDVVRSTRVSVYALGSDGADQIHLGRRFDVVEGGEGGDRISTGRRGDLILPGPGRDAVHAGRGGDQIFGSSGGADVINCGPGRDRVFAGPRDRLRRCERVRRVRERPLVHFGFD
jgi:hypothetical protein